MENKTSHQQLPAVRPSTRPGYFGHRRIDDIVNMAQTNSRSATPPFPLLYTLFFLYIEPVSTLVGAYYAWFRQNDYASMTYSTPGALLGVSTRESIILNQLANLYFVFAFNEALVLRATNDRKVWRAFLLGLLIADFGHLYSVKDVGVQVYWEFWKWNAMYWGNLGFVYIGATMRTAFLLNIGLGQAGGAKKRKS